MKINIADFIGKCECGKTHDMSIKKILLEPGALEQLPKAVLEVGLSGKALIICDKNTWKAAGARAAELLPDNSVIILEGDCIHPDDETVREIEDNYPPGISYIVGVGGGVITDTAKYIGKQHAGTPVVLVPTCASADGFAANSSIMTFDKFKHPLTTQAAVAIIADTNILAVAPYRLTAAGLGDILGKYVALADWKVANLTTGEAICPRIYSMISDAVERTLKAVHKIKDGDTEAIEALMYALILAGLTIQMWGTSRPASGAEHMFGHVWELTLFSPDTGFLHGEAVGVGTVACKKLYEKLIAIIGDNPREFFVPYKGFPHEYLREKIGEIVYGEIMPYNTPDESMLVDYDKLIQNWPAIREACENMPTAAEMEKLFFDCGMKTTLEDLELSDDIMPDTLRAGPYMRGRMTLFRLWDRFTNIEIGML